VVEPTHLKNISEIGSFPQIGDEHKKWIPRFLVSSFPGQLREIKKNV